MYLYTHIHTHVYTYMYTLTYIHTHTPVYTHTYKYDSYAYICNPPEFIFTYEVVLKISSPFSINLKFYLLARMTQRCSKLLEL